GDLQLRDAAGAVVLEMTGLTLRRLAKSMPADAAETLASWLYEVRWQAIEGPVAGREAATGPGTWLLFADGRRVGEALARQLRQHGQRCVEVLPGDDYAPAGGGRYQVNPAEPAHFERLLREAIPPDQPACRGIVYLWALDIPGAGEPHLLEASR